LYNALQKIVNQQITIFMLYFIGLVSIFSFTRIHAIGCFIGHRFGLRPIQSKDKMARKTILAENSFNDTFGIGCFNIWFRNFLQITSFKFVEMALFCQ
jgi:hypothetical protein